MTDLLFPGSGSASSIETIFIEGYKFDICEVMPHCYEYLAPKGKYSRPMGRFFVEVEDSYVVRYDHMVKLHKAGCKNRWDLFCMGRSEAKDKIASFEAMLTDHTRMCDKLKTNPHFSYNLQPKIDSLKIRVLEIYGIEL